MLRQLCLCAIAAATIASVAEAGHHDRVVYYGYSAPAVAVYPTYAPYVISSPVVYRQSVVSYQPAYVVPAAVTHVTYPPVYSYPAYPRVSGLYHTAPIATVSHHSVGYAPMVPTVSSYYAPRFHRSHFHHGYGDEVEIEIKRRPWGYKIEVDYDD